jgi:hypothetical protein
MDSLLGHGDVKKKSTGRALWLSCETIQVVLQDSSTIWRQKGVTKNMWREKWEV